MASKKMINEYTGITDYYDLLVNSGYYDYEKVAREIYAILTNGCKIIELGVGTGLLAKEYLKLDPTCDFTGVDITESMLEIAQKRLSNSIKLVLCDAAQMNLDTTFDAAISNGGVWLFLDRIEGWELASHIPNLESNLQSLQNLASHIRKGGLFILNLQTFGVNHEKSLPGGIIYSQVIEEITNQTNYRTHRKKYYFKQHEKVLAQEELMVTCFKKQVYQNLLTKAGFDFQGTNDTGSLVIYHKQ